MNTKKMMLWLITAVFLTVVFAGAATMQVSAVATFTLTNDNCKDVKNDGIEFRAPVSITDPTTEKFRSNIIVEITDPNGLVGSTGYHIGTDVVKEVALYAASDSTEYQCQQLTITPANNDFSCNSFPAGGTISAVHVTFIPNITGTVPNEVVVHGEYTIKIIESDTTPANVLLSGVAKIDAASTACAQNQGTGTFSPASDNVLGNAFIFTTDTSCAVVADPQVIKFVESSTNPFKIVSFPLGETPDPSRLKLLVTPETNALNYTFSLDFVDKNATAYTVSYAYTKGSKTADIATTSTGTWATAVMPITLKGGTLTIDKDEAIFSLLPTQMNFELKFYYKNVDPTLGYENSMFHFVRDMSVQFANYCTGTGNENYRVASTSYDPCKASKQAFKIPFIDTTTGDGIQLDPCNFVAVDWCTNLSIPETYPDSTTNYYFGTLKCMDATCEHQSGTSSYVSSVVVNDGYYTGTTWGANEVTLSTRARIPMRLFETATNKFELTAINFVADGPGTYYISGFITDYNNPETTKHLDLYVTIPQLDSDLSCYTPGNDGRFEAAWNGCNEDWDSEKIEFKAVNESYSFISNYSNKKMTFTLSAAESFMPTALEMNELYCEWQVLAEGYSADGGSCGAQSITLPPYTRAIVTGGKFTLNGKPTILDDKPYLISYYREETGNDMTLIMQLSINECKQEKIPDTGYSLRSPQPLAGASKSDIIFTGNSLQIPAIGLGMETPIPIVHVSYIGDSFENGWDLTMVGGYVGELEGGAYIPYAGNSVLTGHYYSQGVFVNLTGLHMEDEIYVYATDGMKYIYKVNNSFYTKPNDVYQLFQPNGEKSLTLVTCDSYNLITDEYDNRYVVMATLDHAEPYQMP